MGHLFPRSQLIRRCARGPPRARNPICLARHASTQFGSMSILPGVDPGPDAPEGDDEEPRSKSGKGGRSSGSSYTSTLFKMFESVATTAASIGVLGLAGYSYHVYYKRMVLRKMEKAFEPGDPMLDLASTIGKHSIREPGDAPDELDGEQDQWVLRPEQTIVDEIITGKRRGRYYLLVGEKGTGKTGMILEAMRKIDGEGVAMLEAHADPEIFRIRLGKCLNYDFHEDYIGSLFSIRGPRDTTALLDIERALNKLEKIAMKRRDEPPKIDGQKKGPLVLVINGAHLIRDDEDGNDLIELMQQRAEQWAAANLITMVFNADDYWVYERLKRYATRMEVLQALDLPKPKAISTLLAYRQKYYPDEPVDYSILKQVYDQVGGRLNLLNRVAKSSDMLRMCKTINDAEKTWFLNKCGILGSDMDDDVMDQQKFASGAMVLARALVQKQKEMDTHYHEEEGHILPQIPLFQARYIMTRADFIQSYDHENIFTIDSHAMVRADSVPMMNAFKEICAEEGFDELLEATLERISAIESIGRTKELTFKDLWFEQKGEQRGKYSLITKDARGRETGSIEFMVTPNAEKEEGQDGGSD
ncbi:hypothetical protein DV735_g2750, partial [Chaetothyriales sp. CBS 134920]